MTFPLRITFAGMCMLVRDTTRKDKRTMLHVLMPPVLHHRHLARLVFETRLQDGVSPAEDLTHVSLEHVRLDLRDLVSSTSNASLGTLPSNVFEFSTLDARPIERPYFEENNTFGRVLARITIAAGEAGDAGPSGIWEHETLFGKFEKEMTTSVQWFIKEVPGDALLLDLRGMNGRANGPRLELHPVGGTEEIHLLVLHALEPEIPRRVLKLPSPTFTPTAGFAADHFHAHYDLWSPPINAKNPKFVKLPVLSPSPVSLTSSPAAAASRFRPGPNPAGGSELTCMIGTAQGEPE